MKYEKDYLAWGFPIIIFTVASVWNTGETGDILVTDSHLKLSMYIYLTLVVELAFCNELGGTLNRLLWGWPTFKILILN